MRARHLAARLSVVTILAGCASGSELEESAQDLSAPSAWKNPVSELASETADWRSFDDSILAGYIEQALRNNPDAITAVESLNASRIGLEEAQAARGILYTVGTGASTRNTRDLDSFEAFDISGSASYEIDLWGRNRDRETLAQLDVTAAESAYLTTRISIAAEVADTYYAIRVNDARIALKLDALEYVLQQQKQIQARKDAGIITGVEVDRQEVEVQRLRFQIEDLRGARSIQEDRLAILLGEQPQTFSLAADTSAALPTTQLAPDLPAAVLAARPDIRAAEARLEASMLNLGLARKVFYPTITLTGSSGFASSSLSDLIADQSWTYSIGANLVATLLDNGARRRNAERAAVAARQQIASYRRSILAALADVEAALNQQEVSLRQLEIQQLALASQERVTRETEARYRVGSVPGFELITQQRALINQQEAVLSTRLAGIQATIRLFRAVGLPPANN